jgi:dTDP-4-dehydrorhamnose 3,5-epimerase
MPFEFRPFPELPEAILIETAARVDDRGWFMEAFKAGLFEPHGIPGTFSQDNYSRSIFKGVLRGLHYQKDPCAQGKLVRCVAGSVFDVAVDIRRGSPTYGRWVGAELSAANRLMLWVPPGFAHGFCTTSDVSDVLYKTTTEYSQPHDRAIKWNDPDIGITWPTREPLLSPKDADAPPLAHADNNFVWRR